MVWITISDDKKPLAQNLLKQTTVSHIPSALCFEVFQTPSTLSPFNQFPSASPDQYPNAQKPPYSQHRKTKTMKTTHSFIAFVHHNNSFYVRLLKRPCVFLSIFSSAFVLHRFKIYPSFIWVKGTVVPLSFSSTSTWNVSIFFSLHVYKFICHLSKIYRHHGGIPVKTLKNIPIQDGGRIYASVNVAILGSDNVLKMSVSLFRLLCINVQIFYNHRDVKCLMYGKDAS